MNSKVPWIKFEEGSIHPVYLSGILWPSSILHNTVASLNVLEAQSLQFWSLYKPKLRLGSSIPPWILFLAFVAVGGFSWWQTNKLTTLSFFQDGSTFISYLHVFTA